MAADQDHFKLNAIAGVFQAGCVSLLNLIAEEHGKLPGPWLDELEAEFRTIAKSYESTLSGMANEVASAGAALHAIDQFFQHYRSSLERSNGG